MVVTGSISPVLAGGSLTLAYRKPDSTSLTKTVAVSSTGSFNDSLNPDLTGKWDLTASYSGDATHASATSPTASFTVKKSWCIVATSTYDSELSPEVQFLRDFRDETVLGTFAGKNFMTAFNAWYYSFSPTVASEIAENQILRGFMKVLLYPLIGILHSAAITYSLLSFNPELGVIVSGMVASSLVGIVYFTPLVLILLMLSKRRTTSKAILIQSLLCTMSIGGILLAEIVRSPVVMILSTAVFVLSLMSTSSLISAYSIEGKLQ